jgi:signal transduction histidine kinase/CheY-like chemotaxis protein
MRENDQPRYGFKILNPAHYLDALLFWSVYTSTSIFILWLLASEAKNVFSSSAAAQIVSLTSSTAASLTQKAQLDSSDNLKIMDAVIQANQPLVAGGAIYQVGADETLEPLVTFDNDAPGSLQFDEAAHRVFIRKALSTGRPIFSEWGVLHNRKLPTWLNPSAPLEYSFIRLQTGADKPPSVLILAFNTPVIEERFLEVDRISGYMVALSIVVATCLSFVVRFRSIQRVKATKDKFAAIQLLERRGAILNAVARSADRLLSQRDAENVLNDLLLEIRPQMEARHLYACMQSSSPSQSQTCLGALPQKDPLNLHRLEQPLFATWLEAVRSNSPVVEAADRWNEAICQWADERQLHTLAIFPVHRDHSVCGLLVAEYRKEQTPLDSSFIDILNVTADLFSAALTQREQNERMVQSSKIEALGRMAGGVAHEFNNLLHIISGNLRRLDHGNESEHQLVKKILSASDRGSAIVEQLLRATRQKKTDLAPCSLNTLVQQTAELAERTLGTETKLVTELEPDLPEVLADEGQLQQVILNLLLNARDAQEGRGSIHLRTYRRENEVACEVKDTGPGIPSGDLEQVFDPFFTTKGPGEGTGLGLSTCRGILEQHSGTIQAQNRSEGGACFIFTLPIPKILPARSERSDSNLDPSSPPRESGVLIADDEELCREVISDILKDYGYQVYAASGGEEAIELAREHKDRIGWVITDWTMPGLHGSPLLAGLRRELPTASLIVASGYAITGHDVPLMDGFISKPFTPDMLIDALKAYPPVPTTNG